VRAGLVSAPGALATALHGAGRLEEALAMYGVAEKSDPRNAVLLCNYAMLLCAGGSRSSREGRLLIARAESLQQQQQQQQQSQSKELADAKAACGV
jgi:Tfp pilus assembly protein PilF